MYMVRPNVRGHQNKELIWARNWPQVAKVALPVNEDELTDNLVVRYRFSLLEKLRILFGQDLFIWFSTYGKAPQWPMPVLTDPVYTKLEFADGSPSLNKVLPTKPEQWFAHVKENIERGYAVENPNSDQDVIAPDLEAQLKRTVQEVKAENQPRM